MANDIFTKISVIRLALKDSPDNKNYEANKKFALEQLEKLDLKLKDIFSS